VVEDEIEHQFSQEDKSKLWRFLTAEVCIIELFEQCSSISQDPVRELERMQHGARAEQYGTASALTTRCLSGESLAKEILTC